MKTVIETITPDRALRYLAMNHGNRALRQSWVDQLAAQMKSGNWQLSHQGVAISKDGRLLDGQHRLTAIVQSGVSVQMNVSTGVDQAVYKVTDCGVKRLAHDRLHLVDNLSINRLLCTIVNHYCRYALRTSSGQIPVSTIEDEFLRYSDSWLWVAQVFAVKQPIYHRAGVLTGIAIYHVVNGAKAEAFAHGYRTGEGLECGSPILALRRSIERADKDGTEDYWKTAQATRAHLKNEQIKNLYAASVDMIGNNNSWRVLKERQEKGVKAAVTRAARKKVTA